MTVKELEAAFTAAAETSMQKAEALGLSAAALRAQCDKACLEQLVAAGYYKI